MSRHFAWLLCLMLLTATVVGADDQDDPKAIAVKVTAAGTSLFDARDAKGLAQTYTEDARLDLYSKENSGELKLETKVGRAEIQAGYEEMFKSQSVIHAKSTIEHARRIDADMILFSGIFEPNTESAEPLKLPFTQVRIRQGDSWKIVSLQLFVMLQK